MYQLLCGFDHEFIFYAKLDATIIATDMCVVYK